MLAIRSLAKSRSNQRPLGTTQITTDAGVVVEQAPIEIRTKITQVPKDIIDGTLANLFASLAEAADEYAEQIGKQFYEYIGRVSEATGNVVDAKGKPFFEYVYEMFDKIELRFDDEGRIQQQLHINPADAEKWAKGEESLTQEERERLNALIDRKREEFNARRRNRRLPRRG